MMREFIQASRDYDFEVQQEAAKLIEQGEAPWCAFSMAINKVSERRKRRGLWPKAKRPILPQGDKR